MVTKRYLPLYFSIENGWMDGLLCKHSVEQHDGKSTVPGNGEYPIKPIKLRNSNLYFQLTAILSYLKMCWQVNTHQLTLVMPSKVPKVLLTNKLFWELKIQW